MKRVIRILATGILWCQPCLHGTQIVSRSTTQETFNQPITATELDQYTGTLYVTTNGDGQYAAAFAGRNDTTFTPLIPAGSPLINLPVHSLALMATTCQAATNLAIASPQLGDTLALQNLSTNVITISDTLHDAAGNPISYVSTLAASPTCLFARVIANQTPPIADEPDNSGIATLLSDATIIQGDTITPAALLDRTSTQIHIGADLLVTIVRNMTWNERLQQFYAGLTIIAQSDAGGANVGYGLVRGTTDDCSLTLDVVTGSEPAIGTSQAIFAVRPNVANTNDGVNAFHIGVMNTSTGLNYLIMNGNEFSSQAYIVTNQDGLGTPINNQVTTDTSGNNVFALPLGSNPMGNGTATSPVAGNVVQNMVTSAMQMTCCNNACTACPGAFFGSLATPLPSNFTLTSCALIVGGGTAPWQASVTGVYTGTNIAYYNRIADSQVVSNVEDPAAGDANGNANAGYTFLVRFVQGNSLVQTTQPATDMHVIGDAVYVSSGDQVVTTPLIIPANFMDSGNDERIISVPVCIQEPRSATNDTGIWVSQALFDNTGALSGWTAWERVFPTTGDGQADKVAFFAVDAQTARIWNVNGASSAYCGNTAELVQRTTWTLEGASGSLLAALDAAFGSRSCSLSATSGTFSVLDLPGAVGGTAGTDGLSGTTAYTLFGGFGAVAFARTQQTNNVTTAPTAFTIPANFKLTSLPACAGAVTTLGYTNVPSSEGARNLFFAGTPAGLFAYAQADGLGFATGSTEFTALDAAPFDPATDSWFAVPHTSCFAITAIDSDHGSNIYFVAQDVCDALCVITDKLYKISLENIATTPVQNLEPILIAQSGTGGLPRNALFTGFTVVSSLCSNDTETFYGVLSTNDGLYISTVPLNDVALNNGDWQAVDRTTCTAFNSLRNASKLHAPLQNTARNKVFGTYFIDGGGIACGTNCQNIFQSSGFIQAGNTGATMAAHPDFNEPAPDERRFFTNLNQAIEFVPFSISFWSDGARRLFITLNPGACHLTALASLPYDACIWNMSEPFIDSALSGICRINWIENSAGSGQLLVGTDQGVVALQ